MLKSLKQTFAVICMLLFAVCMHTPAPAFQKAAKLEKLFETLEKDGSFNGVVLVAEKGKIIFKKAVGFGNFEKNERLTVNSLFDIASVSKTITSVAIHILAERSMLSLDDPISKFFPKLEYEGVTVGGLLSHTSGFYDIAGSKEFRSDYNRTDRPYTNKDYLSYIEKYKPPLLSKPGEKFSYSNTGYVLLGLIVEKASGEEYDAFVKKNIFEPAGMDNTIVFSKMKDPKKAQSLFQGYIKNAESKLVPVFDPNAAPSIYGLTYGDDDIASTVDDLFAFDQALRTEKLLNPETVNKAMSSVTLTDGSVTSYGYGFSIFMRNDLRFVAHSGGTSGFLAYCKFSRPENDNTVILLTNVAANGSIFKRTRDTIFNIMSGLDYEIPKL